MDATFATKSPPPAASATGPTYFHRVRVVASALVFLALASLVFLLAAENRRLEGALAMAAGRTAGGLTVGDSLPAFDLVPVQGAADPTLADIAEGGLRDAVLFFFTTTCKACEQNHESWARLNRELGGTHDVLAIGLGNPGTVAAYAEEHDLPYAVAAADDYVTPGLGLAGVPLTLLIDSEGRVAVREIGVLPAGWRP